jgi:hypothetical protein
MRNLLPCLLVALLLAACGGGNNASGANNVARGYVPDFSTPEGATEAYCRAIETGNKSLMALALMDEEREKLMSAYAQDFAKSKQAGLTWKIEPVDQELLEDKEAHVKMKFIALKDGEEQQSNTRWLVFAKTDDGTWKYSDRASQAMNRAAKNAKNAEKPPANGEQPADNTEQSAANSGG